MGDCSTEQDRKACIKEAAKRLTSPFVFNNSNRSVWVKPESESTEPVEVDPYSLYCAGVDGIASWNQSAGKVGKCPNLNFLYVGTDGVPKCYGYREEGGVGTDPDYNHNQVLTGDDWKPMRDKADAIANPGQGAGNGGGGNGNGGGGNEPHGHGMDGPHEHPNGNEPSPPADVEPHTHVEIEVGDELHDFNADLIFGTQS